MNRFVAERIGSYLIVAGLAVVMGVSYEVFVFPNAFAPAGINGLATMVQYLIHVSIGYLSLLINIPLLALAWKRVDREFALKNLVFVLVFSAVTLALNQVDLSAVAYHTDNGSSAILAPVAARCGQRGRIWLCDPAKRLHRRHRHHRRLGAQAAS